VAPNGPGSAVFSAVIYLLFWDGELNRLDNKGGIGILIDLAILAVVLIPFTAAWLSIAGDQ
jgi:hypothetical protein